MTMTTLASGGRAFVEHEFAQNEGMDKILMALSKSYFLPHMWLVKQKQLRCSGRAAERSLGRAGN